MSLLDPHTLLWWLAGSPLATRTLERLTIVTRDPAFDAYDVSALRC